jgi:hypothetical protein
MCGLKYIECTPENSRVLWENKVIAEVKKDKEYGIYFAFVELEPDQTSVVLYLEPHHTRREIEIAAARIQALHFFDRMLAVTIDDLAVAA